MLYIQDGIEYKIKDEILKGWKGRSPFKMPFWDVVTQTIIESAPADYDATRLASAKAGKIAELQNAAVIELNRYQYYQIKSVFDKTEIPKAILAAGDVIFAEVAAKTVEINALTTIDEVIKYDINA